MGNGWRRMIGVSHENAHWCCQHACSRDVTEEWSLDLGQQNLLEADLSCPNSDSQIGPSGRKHP
jgi:hypothetical protein